jgi:hypothetical protein
MERRQRGAGPAAFDSNAATNGSSAPDVLSERPPLVGVFTQRLRGGSSGGR